MNEMISNMNQCLQQRQVSIKIRFIPQVIHRIVHRQSSEMFFMLLLFTVEKQTHRTLNFLLTEFDFSFTDARDVMRICLKYGIDPNASGTHPHPQNYFSPSSTFNQINSRLSPDLPHASSCRNGTLDYTNYYTTDRLFTLPPLFLAAQRNNHYACTLLLKFGANVNVRDELLCSPLHLAARLQHNVCDILICHHAAITIMNKFGDTPLSLWPAVKHLQTSFVEKEFRKLCRKHSSSSKRYRFLSRDCEQYPAATTSLLNFNSLNSFNNNHNSSLSNATNTNNNFIPGNGLKNLKRVFRYSGTDSNDSKSFKKSFSSQSSMSKSKRLTTHNPASSIGRSESRQLSEERDENELSHAGRLLNLKRKVCQRKYLFF